MARGFRDSNGGSQLDESDAGGSAIDTPSQAIDLVRMRLLLSDPNSIISLPSTTSSSFGTCDVSSCSLGASHADGSGNVVYLRNPSRRQPGSVSTLVADSD
jgi:hypothetical protein